MNSAMGECRLRHTYHEPESLESLLKFNHNINNITKKVEGSRTRHS